VMLDTQYHMLDERVSRIQNREYKSLFHCPVAKGCAAGFFMIREVLVVMLDRILNGPKVMKD